MYCSNCGSCAALTSAVFKRAASRGMLPWGGKSSPRQRPGYPLVLRARLSPVLEPLGAGLDDSAPLVPLR
jgi:hypothetical protein